MAESIAPSINAPNAAADPRSAIVSDAAGAAYAPVAERPGTVAHSATIELPAAYAPPFEMPMATAPHVVGRQDGKSTEVEWRTLLARCPAIPFHPAIEGHLFDASRPQEAPSEEFRILRTRLNHMQSSEDLRSIVVTSPSPAEGKTFVAVNLALAQAQLETPVLLMDLDLRRPTVHDLLSIGRTPGFSDFVLGHTPLHECMRRLEGTNLYVMPAGTLARNPLELLNMRHVRALLENLRKVFGWIIMDTPPLLFSADANLMATLTDGAILVVRIGSTTYDNVVRAMQSLCENNVLGIVANGARAGELYSKYTYYYQRTQPDEAEGIEAARGE